MLFARPRRLIDVVALALRDCLSKCQELGAALAYKQQHQHKQLLATPP
jgi:hypothetical protein